MKFSLYPNKYDDKSWKFANLLAENNKQKENILEFFKKAKNYEKINPLFSKEVRKESFTYKIKCETEIKKISNIDKSIKNHSIQRKNIAKTIAIISYYKTPKYKEAIKSKADYTISSSLFKIKSNKPKIKPISKSFGDIDECHFHQ